MKRLGSSLRWLSVLGMVLAVQGANAMSPPDRCAFTRLKSTLHAAQEHRGHARAESYPAYKSAGQYLRMDDHSHEKLAALFRAQGVAKPLEGTIERVTKNDLVVDFNDLDKNPALREKVLSLGMAKMKHLHRDVLAAGLWSRGAGEVKAMVAANIKKLVSPEQYRKLMEAQKVGVLTETEEILKAADYTLIIPRSERDGVAKRLKIAAQKTVLEISEFARKDPRSVTFADLHLIDAALNSKKTKSYVSLDFYVGEDTHVIAEHIAEFRKNFQTKIFDEQNPARDQAIKNALSEYFQLADQHGDTFLLAYQEGFYPLDAATLKPVKDEPVLGAGAGTLPSALKNSGRLAELATRGKSIEISGNIEVLPNLAESVGAFEMGGTTVNVQLAPTQPGYSGGNAFKVTQPGKASNYQLVETALLPKDSPLKSDNPWFNTNSMTRKLQLDGHEQVDFELKSARNRVAKVIRAKVSSGAITEVQQTSVTGVRAGQDYENFKDWGEVFQNGESFYDKLLNRTWSHLF